MSDDTKFTKVPVQRGDDQVPRDRWGRYLLPDPYGDESSARAWTRVTTIAGELKDRYGLERWDDRNIVWGIGQRPALWAQAAAAKLTDVQTLDKIADRAKEAADSSAGADLGSALHTMAERMDRGEDLDIPDPFAADLAAYRKAMEIAGIDTCVGWIERVVVIPEIGACGTLDRLSNAMEWVLPRIGDIKSAGLKEDRQTKKERDPITTYGMQDIPLQLAMYAHATHWRSPHPETGSLADGQWVEMPPIDQKRAMVYHIPAGSGLCRIYEIDIEAGWEAVRYAMWERDWRKRKDLYTLTLSIDIHGEVIHGQPEDKGGGSASSDVVPSKGSSAGTGNGASSSEPTEVGNGEAAGTPTEDPPAQPSPPPAARGPIAGEVDRKRETLDLLAYQVDHINELYGDDAVRAWEQLSELPNVDEPLAPVDQARYAWARDRVNALKEHPEARRRLASLWSVFDFVPLFPNDRNPDRTGPRTWAELSKVIGMLDLVEMEFQLPFPPGSDPNPDVVMPTPAERRAQREQKYQDDQKAGRKAAAAKARATRKRNQEAKS